MLDNSSVIDPGRPNIEQSAALRHAMEACYCGLGPACYLWRQMTPEQRVECSLDKRFVAQRFWKTGMQ